MKKHVLFFIFLSYILNAQAELLHRADVGVNLWNRDWATKEKPFISGANMSVYGNIWNPAFIDDIKIFKYVRFMDWNKINGSSVSNWGGRTGMTSTSVIAYEHCISLCNHANIDMWVNIPHKVFSSTSNGDNDYCKRLAILIKTGVDMKAVSLAGLGDLTTKTQAQFIAAGGVKTCEPLNSNLKVYIEYSNETWNPGFSQQGYCDTQGNALGFTNGGTGLGKSYKFQVWAAIRMFESFAKVFSPTEMTARVVKIVAAQDDNAFATNMIYLPALKNSVINPNNTSADGYSIANYWCRPEGMTSDPTTLAQLITAANEKRHKTMKVATNIAMAGLPIIAYEGGMNWVNGAAPAMDKQVEMYSAYKSLLHSISPYYSVIGQYTLTEGQWGLKTSTGESLTTAHKYRAFAEFIDSCSVGKYVVDTEKPKGPPSVTIKEIGPNYINFDITPGASDDRYLKFYKTYVNGTVVSYNNYDDYKVSVRNLLPLTSYTIKVTAMDAQGNESLDFSFTRTTRETLPDMYVKKIASAITLDGAIDALWNTVTPVVMDKIVINKVIDYTVTPEDLSGTFRMAYTDTYLYFMCEVYDDIKKNTTETTCAAPYNDDCMEIFLDMGNQKATSYDTDDDQIAFPMTANATLTCYKKVYNPSYKTSYDATNKKWIIEGSFPWGTASQALKKTAVEGLKFGVEVMFNDDDDDAVNGLARDHKLGWNYMADVASTNPSTFGTAMLSTTKSGAEDFTVSQIILNPNIPDGIIESVEKKMGLQAYNNGSTIFLKFNGEENQNYTVSVISTLGQVVFSSRNTISLDNDRFMEIPSSSFQSGIYIIRVTNTRGKAEFTKILL